MNKKDPFLQRLRRICLALPETDEVVTWGHPTFRAAGKTFAVYEEYKGVPSLAFKAGLAGQPGLLEEPRFYRTPYIGNRGWVSLDVRRKVDWDEVRALVESSYRLVAPPRLARAIGARR